MVRVLIRDGRAVRWFYASRPTLTVRCSQGDVSLANVFPETRRGAKSALGGCSRVLSQIVRLRGVYQGQWNNAPSVANSVAAILLTWQSCVR